MQNIVNAAEVARQMRQVRQVRQYEPAPVSDDILNAILEVARWTGSSRNTQPWHFIVVNDNGQLKALSGIRTAINWLNDAPVAIAIVLNGENAISEAYDEGRVTQQIMAAAKMYGLSAGTAWFLSDEEQTSAKRILGVPDNRTLHSVVALGYGITAKDPRPNPAKGGRRPMDELVSYNRFGERPPHETKK